MINLQKLKQLVKEKYNTQYIHMPYIYYSSNKPYFLFDININGNWKIFLYKDQQIKQIKTQSSELVGINNCNPFIIKNNQTNKYNFGYTYNLCAENRFDFYLYNSNLFIDKYTKTPIAELHNSNVYYLNNNIKILLSYCDSFFEIINIKDRNIKQFQMNSIYNIMCIRPIFNTNKLIFTFANRNTNMPNDTISLIYNQEDDSFKYIFMKNKELPSIYKCSIDPINGDLYYAVRNYIGFQDRTIEAVTKEEYQLLDTNIIKRIS